MIKSERECVGDLLFNRKLRTFLGNAPFTKTMMAK